MRTDLLLALTLAPTLAHAEPTTACKEHYVAARFEAARRCFTRALPELTEQATGICEAYAFIAATDLGEEDPVAARRAIDVALAIDPAFDPVDPLLRSPRVQDLLDQARPSGGSGRPVLIPSEPDGSAEGAVLFSVHARNVRLPLSVHMRYRFGTATELLSGWRQSLLPESETEGGVRVAAIPRLSDARRIEYSFTVQTPEGAVVTRVGSDDGPLVKDLSARRAGHGNTVPPPRVTPWYGSWWFWTGLGAVAVGAVLVVLLIPDDEVGSIRIQIE